MPLFGTQGIWQGQDRLGHAARRALQRAESAGAVRGASATTPDDLLLALLEEPDSMAVRALIALGIDVLTLRQTSGAATGEEGAPQAKRVSLDAAAREAVILGVNEARRAGLESADTGHLLLGLLEAREGAGVSFLVRQHVDVKALRSVVAALLEPADLNDMATFDAAFVNWLRTVGGIAACSRCGAPLHDSFRYCYRCGHDTGPWLSAVHDDRDRAPTE